MKKKWLSALALSMCFTIGVSAFAGCNITNQGNNSSDNSNAPNSSSTENTEETSLTQDEIYAKIWGAIEATNQYEGAYAMKGESKEYSKVGEVIKGGGFSEFVTYDPATNKAYSQSTYQTMEVGSDKSVQTTKYFKEGDSYYSYDKVEGFDDSGLLDYSEEKYTNSSVESIEKAMEGNSPAIFDDFGLKEFGCLEKDSSIEALNSAFAEVFSESKAEVLAGSTDENSQWYGYTADGDYVVSCTEEADGSLAMTIQIKVEVAEGDYYNKGNNQLKIVASGGYITEFSMKYASEYVYIESTDDSNDSSSLVTVQSEYSTDVEVVYAFANDVYDAVETNLPDNVEEEPKVEIDEWYYIDVYVVVNGYRRNKYSYNIAGETVQVAVEEFLNYNLYGMNVVWYTDEACTKLLSTDITEEEMNAIEMLYGKTTLQEGYAFIVEEYKNVFADDVTDAYKMVSDIFVDNKGDLVDFEFVMNYGLNLSDYETIKFDGEEVVFTEEDGSYKHINVTAGATHKVEYINIYTKADLNIFLGYMY